MTDMTPTLAVSSYYYLYIYTFNINIKVININYFTVIKCLAADLQLVVILVYLSFFWQCCHCCHTEWIYLGFYLDFVKLIFTFVSDI